MTSESINREHGETIPITKPTLPALDEYKKKLERLWSTGQITNGALVEEAERLLEGYIGNTNCVATANCTIGLVLACKALGLKGSVVLPSFTFFASAHILAWNNLEPVFADIDERTWNISPESVKEILQQRPDVSAVLGVHIFGNPCNVQELEALAGDYGVTLLFDAAHALGAESNRRKIGTSGDVEVFSLSPTKPLVAAEGGIVSTSHEELAEVLRYGRNYGNEGDYDPSFIGLNARLSELHAAMALGSLEMLDTNVNRRNQMASRYKDNLISVPGIRYQEIREADRSTFKDFTVYIEPEEFGLSRDTLSWWLKQQRIDTRKYYSPPVHRTRAYWDRWGKHRDSELPITKSVSNRVLSLPMWSHMDVAQVDRVCESIIAAHNRAAEVRHQFKMSLPE